jgi:hypothetical protein
MSRACLRGALIEELQSRRAREHVNMSRIAMLGGGLFTLVLRANAPAIIPAWGNAPCTRSNQYRGLKARIIGRFGAFNASIVMDSFAGAWRWNRPSAFLVTKSGPGALPQAGMTVRPWRAGTALSARPDFGEAPASLAFRS